MKSLLQKTFENAFNETHYKELILNLFNRFDFSREHTLKHQFNEAERQALNDFTYFGTYEDAEKKCLDVLTVELKSSSKVERARSLQRNLIGKYLKSNLKDSALVAFYSKDNPDWRLSFVKMDYRLDEKGVKTEIGTPPKRYSFLVGKTEPSHTAQKQLLPLLDDKKIPAIDEIEKLFSIEKVTKEFYTEIAKKFTELVGGERKNGSKKMVEKGCLRLPSTDNDTIEKEFAVRLIGRLLFCWFLKKKKSEKGEPLLTSVLISSDAVNQEKNYYHRFLEPLFFHVLNTPQEKRKDCFKHEFWGKIPFLNGGLFEPHRHDFYESTEPFGHSKHINTLKIPDEWFLELFKLFELYNFTIDESTTIDVDISVDPEMLGRIFENLLAEINPVTGETARKSTGSYYTPRPIVEYMVDESLKQYLLTQISSDKNVIPVKTGIQKEKELDSCLRRNDDNGMETKISRLLSYAESDIDLSEEEKDLIIDALDRLKIIDPACGSGAFPMGILHKMLLILQKIDPESKKWLSRKLARIDNEILRKELEKKLRTENWDYVHKLGIIQNSIYGVDIQPIAVEISKLRFFLSLIVDEKIDDGKPNRGVVPLPNLEFKFVAANSLIGLPKAEGGFAESHADIERLKELRETYFTSYGDEKREIERKFGETQHKMFLHALNWQATGSQTYKLSEWNPFADEAASWFDPEWMFGVKDGVDVVIANPPYINVEKLDENLKKYIFKNCKTCSGRTDIYIAFIESFLNLLKNNGSLCYIIPYAFTNQKYGTALRKLLIDKYFIKEIVDTSNYFVFDAAIVKNIILLVAKIANQSNTSIKKVISQEDFINNKFQSLITNQITFLKLKDYRFETQDVSSSLKIKEKILSISIPFDKICFIAYGARLNHKAKDIGKEHYLKDEYKDGLKPFLEGKNIQRYYFTQEGWLDYKPKEHYNPMFKELFENKKIMFINVVKDRLRFAYDGNHFYNSHTVINCVKWELLFNAKHISVKRNINKDNIETSKKYDNYFLLAVLNSNLINWYFLNFLTEKLHFYPDDAKCLPIIKMSDTSNQKPIIVLVDQILSIKKQDPSADTSALERQIDEMVYKLYDLTPEEIAIVEGKSKG